MATISGNILSIVGVGITNISALQSGNGSFNPAPTINQSLTVSPKPLTINASINTKVYDGTSVATLSGTLIGIIGADIVSFSGTGVYAIPNAGIGIPVTSTSSILGVNANNYTLIQPTGLTGSISPRLVTLE